MSDIIDFNDVRRIGAVGSTHHTDNGGFNHH